jgi:hypothetical protein
MIIITTDHGRDEKTGSNHGGQSARQRGTWMVTNYKDLNNYARYYEPAIVDIMPTIARFLHVTIPVSTAREVDGVPLIGKVAVANAVVNYIQGNIDIKWQPLQDTGKVKIWVTTTNEFKTGGKDEYKLLAEVPVKTGHALVDVQQLPAEMYKIVLETSQNTINRWLKP